MEKEAPQSGSDRAVQLWVFERADPERQCSDSAWGFISHRRGPTGARREPRRRWTGGGPEPPPATTKYGPARAHAPGPHRRARGMPWRDRRPRRGPHALGCHWAGGRPAVSAEVVAWRSCFRSPCLDLLSYGRHQLRKARRTADFLWCVVSGPETTKPRPGVRGPFDPAEKP